MLLVDDPARSEAYLNFKGWVSEKSVFLNGKYIVSNGFDRLYRAFAAKQNKRSDADKNDYQLPKSKCYTSN